MSATTGALRGAIPAFAGLMAGCAVGPGYRPAPVVAPTVQVSAGAHIADSVRALLDSLAAARAADSAGRAQARLEPHPLTAGQVSDLAWLDIIHDSVLARLVETALRQNRDLALARARVSEFRAQAGAAQAPLLPRVTLNGSAGRNRIVIGAFPPVAFNALRVTGDLVWELDFWGRMRRGMQAANADLAAQEAAERGMVLSLVSDVASGYLRLLELDQEHAIATRTVGTRAATLGLARDLFARGVNSELDVRQFEAQLAVPAQRLAQVERLRAQQENALSALIGQAPGSVPRGVSLAEAARAVVPPDSVPATLLARRPDVLQADREYAAATARIGAAQAARLPTISAIGSYGTQSPIASGLFASGAEVYQLQGGISIPLSLSGRLVRDVDAARARADQARARYERTSLNALREAGDALAAARTTRDEVAAGETQVAALRRATELAELRYQAGIANYLEVLDVQRTLFDAELALSQAQLGQLTAAVQLYKALGGSWTAQR